jgi:diguanylate cyclase (GGDEF)-like protein
MIISEQMKKRVSSKEPCLSLEAVAVFFCLFPDSSQIEQDITEIYELKEKFRAMSIKDALTGAYNRNYMREQNYEDEKFMPVSYMIFDADNLKKVNDVYGHSRGDQYLKDCVHILMNCIPQRGFVSRIGGDEFAIVIPNCPVKECSTYYERIRRRAAKTHGTENEVGLSGGYAVRGSVNESMESVMQKADQMLYGNKQKVRRSLQLRNAKTEKTKKNFDQLLTTFLIAIQENNNTEETIEPALNPLAEYFGIGRVTIMLDVKPNPFTPRGEYRESTLYHGAIGYDDNYEFRKEYEVERNGKCVLIANPEPGRGPWTFEDSARIAAVFSAILLHAARFRLIGKNETARFTNYLTGLPNSGGFINELMERIGNQTVSRYTAIYFNIVGFGVINARFGMHEGNEVIYRYVDVFRENMEEGEVLAHFGGDNFALLIYNENYEKFRDLLNSVDVFAVENGQRQYLTLRAAAGVMPLYDEIKSPGQVMAGIGFVLNLARESHGGQVYFTPDMEERVNRMKEIEILFPQALLRKEFEVLYQPKVDIFSGTIIGAEALSGWEKGDKRLPPDSYIPIIERNGQIKDLDMFMLEKVLRDMSAWKAAGYGVLPISVNFSRKDFSGRKDEPMLLADRIAEKVSKYGMRSGELVIEVTETNNTVEMQRVDAFMRQLSRHDIRTSVDDFGTGCSSFEMVKELPVDEIKIDRSFLRCTIPEKRDRVIIRSIATMARSLGISVVVEGVETVQQAEFLNEIGCNCAQGFLYDPPMIREKFLKKLGVGSYRSLKELLKKEGTEHAGMV